MTQEQRWQEWRNQQSEILGELISWAVTVFQTTDAEIEMSRHCGARLVAHSIECARAIRLCTRMDLPGPAFALARVHYEAALRGHIILHEFELEALNDFLRQIQRWRQDRQHEQWFPQIQLSGIRWSFLPRGTKCRWRSLQDPAAIDFANTVKDRQLLHDLTHSGMTQALQMSDEDGLIGPSYSNMNQTLLLWSAVKAVMFAITTWPGAEQKYYSDIKQRSERYVQMIGEWESFSRSHAG